MRAAWLQAVRREGLLSAYRGFGVAVGSMFVYKSLYFGLYVSGVSALRWMGSKGSCSGAAAVKS